MGLSVSCAEASTDRRNPVQAKERGPSGRPDQLLHRISTSLPRRTEKANLENAKRDSDLSAFRYHITPFPTDRNRDIRGWH
jgi:hypothetical protein